VEVGDGAGRGDERGQQRRGRGGEGAKQGREHGRSLPHRGLRRNSFRDWLVARRTPDSNSYFASPILPVTQRLVLNHGKQLACSS